MLLNKRICRPFLLAEIRLAAISAELRALASFGGGQKV